MSAITLQNQSIRLLRDDWSNPNMLSQELYSMFNALTTDSVQGPQQVQKGSDGPAFTFGGYQPSDVVFSAPGPNPGETVNITFNDLTTIAGSGGGGGGGGTVSAASNAMPGVVTGGSGDSYTMTVYPHGITRPSKTVTVKQMQIDPSETIDPGTWAIVIQCSDGYYMQAPIWM